MLHFFCLLLALSDPNQTKELLQRGLIALKQGQLAEARENLEAVSRLDPTNPYVWASLAQTYQRLKEPQKAMEAAQTAEKLANGNPVVCHALAMYYSQCGQYEAAARCEAQYAESPGADSNALSRAASLYLSAERAERALPLAERAAREHPSAPNEDLLGRIQIAGGQSDEGVRHLETAWKSGSPDPQIAFDYAQALLKNEQFTRAAEVVDTALQAHPRDPQLVLTLGVARYGQRRFEDSITAFMKVIEIDPTIEQPYVFLGRMLDQAGTHLDEITKVYEALAARETENATAQVLLAKALLATDAQSERAETLLRRSIELDSGKWESHYELGALLERKRNYSAAVAELARSIELDATQPVPHYHLARVYDRLGQPERARAEREIHEKLANSGAQRP